MYDSSSRETPLMRSCASGGRRARARTLQRPRSSCRLALDLHIHGGAVCVVRHQACGEAKQTKCAPHKIIHTLGLKNGLLTYRGIPAIVGYDTGYTPKSEKTPHWGRFLNRGCEILNVAVADEVHTMFERCKQCHGGALEQDLVPLGIGESRRRPRGGRRERTGPGATRASCESAISSRCAVSTRTLG